MQIDLNKDHPYPEFVEKKMTDAVQRLIIEAFVQETEFVDLPQIEVVDLRFDGNNVRGVAEADLDNTIVRHPINLQHATYTLDRRSCIGVCIGGSLHFNDLEGSWVRLQLETVQAVE